MVQNLVTAGALEENLFAFYLARNEVSGAVLSIGKTNPAHFTGDITCELSESSLSQSSIDPCFSLRHACDESDLRTSPSCLYYCKII